LVVLDEAYIDFADRPGWLNRLQHYPNLVILQTFSKAMGLAGARLGMAFAHRETVAVLNRIKFPYNVNRLTARAALRALERQEEVAASIAFIRREREWLRVQLSRLQRVEQIYPSQANFLLVRFRDARAVHQSLRSKGILVRDRSHLPGCSNCLRITVGSREQNQRLLQTLQAMEVAS
ncbi:MAG: aminotransferase class I/II-fold pyridoxal phosphate-dependent enzyme, partial [Calditrichaeota bacterium]